MINDHRISIVQPALLDSNTGNFFCEKCDVGEIRRFEQNRLGQSHGAKLNGFDLGNAHEYRLHHSYSNIIIGSKSNAYQDLLNCAGSASFLLFSLIYSQQFSGPLLP